MPHLNFFIITPLYGMHTYNGGLSTLTKYHTVHPSEIVLRLGPPSVDHEESDRKVSHSYIAN
jgi:hypothetical protein